MNSDAVIVGVFCGLVLYRGFMWGIGQFRDDDETPWIAYIAVLGPLLFCLAQFITEGLPPQFDALALR